MLQREEIYQRVWGYAMAHGDRSVDVFVRKLRHKLEAGRRAGAYIHTHFGIGYRFQPERPGEVEDSAPPDATAAEPRAGVPSEHSPELPPDPEPGEYRARATAGALDGR